MATAVVVDDIHHLGQTLTTGEAGDPVA